MQAFKKPFFLIGIVMLIMGAGVLLFMYNPSVSSIFPPCPFHKLTGLYCPGCGSLRALHQLLHGNVLAALDLNFMMVLSLPFVGYGLLAQGLRYFFDIKIPIVFLPAGLIWIIFGLIVAYGIARNIPVSPLTYLAP